MKWQNTKDKEKNLKSRQRIHSVNDIPGATGTLSTQILGSSTIPQQKEPVAPGQMADSKNGNT